MRRWARILASLHLVFAPSNLLGLTAKTLISDCVGSWSVSQVCFMLFQCQDIQMHDNLSLWCFFFSFFTFGQSPVQVKQITISFFKILQKVLVFRSKGIQNLNTEQKRTKIRHRNVKNRETTSRFTKISINRPPLFWWSCKSGTSHLKETPSFPLHSDGHTKR